jgi:signal transduction histidine kinase/ActR/RegA family two-component response regulator
MPARAPTSHDPNAPRALLERTVNEAMPSVLGAFAAIAGLFAAADLVSLPPSARAIVVYDVATSLACLGGRVVWQRSTAIRRYLHPVGALFGVLFASNTLATMSLTGEMAYSSHLAVMLVGAGAFFISVPWIVAYDVLIGAAWVVIARHIATPAQQWAHGIALLLSVALAAILQTVRLRAYTRIALLRARDARRRGKLRAVAAKVRSELEHRRRAETEEQRLREQLLQARKMDAVGRLAGGVAHEINNALASIVAVSELLLEDERLDPVTREDVGSIREASERAADLTRKLSAVGRTGKYATDVLDPGELVDSALRSIAGKLRPEIEVIVERGHGDAQIEGDANQLVAALRSLCVNAADAMPDGGILSVRTSRVTLLGDQAHSRAVTPGEYVAIAVQDTGPGMDSETRRLAFDPFFTTKPFGTSSGLGLPSVYGTARNHGGSAEIDSARGRGTTATLHVPCVVPHADRETPVPASGMRRDVRGRTVLLVDDEPAVRAAARRILERMGVVVREAENGRRALEIVATEGPFDLFVVDLAMPVMGGKELFLRLRETRIDPCVLLVSGFGPDDEARALLAAGAVGFLEKPYTLTALTRAVRAALTTDREAPSATKA